MNEPKKNNDADLSPEELKIIRWQEAHPNVWSMKLSEQPDAPCEPYEEIDQETLEARLRENLKLTPAERLQRMGERLRAAQREGRYLFDESEESVLPYTVLTSP